MYIVGLPAGIKRITPGMTLALVTALLAYVTWWVSKDRMPISALMWAFIYSILATNLFGLATRCRPGIEFAASGLLQITVASLGIVVSALSWWRLGGVGLASVFLNLAITFSFALLLCRSVFKLEDRLAVLIAVGTTICGASAIAVTSPAVKAKGEQVALALAVVTLFGLAAMFGYPWLFQSTRLGVFLGNDANAFGVWSGIGIHETAQVLASASQIDGSLNMAVLTKSIRIFMIGPMVLLSVLYLRLKGHGETTEARRFSVPWFAVVFVAFTFLHAGLELAVGEAWVHFAKTYLKPPITFLIAWAFAGVGFKVRFRDVIKMGGRAFACGLIVALVSGLTGLALVKFLWLPHQ